MVQQRCNRKFRNQFWKKSQLREHRFIMVKPTKMADHSKWSESVRFHGQVNVERFRYKVKLPARRENSENANFSKFWPKNGVSCLPTILQAKKSNHLRFNCYIQGSYLHQLSLYGDDPSTPKGNRIFQYDKKIKNKIDQNSCFSLFQHSQFDVKRCCQTLSWLYRSQGS